MIGNEMDVGLWMRGSYIWDEESRKGMANALSKDFKLDLTFSSASFILKIKSFRSFQFSLLFSSNSLASNPLSTPSPSPSSCFRLFHAPSPYFCSLLPFHKIPFLANLSWTSFRRYLLFYIKYCRSKVPKKRKIRRTRRWRRRRRRRLRKML